MKSKILTIFFLLSIVACKGSGPSTTTKTSTSSESKKEEQIKTEDKVPTSSPTESKSSVVFNESNVKVINPALLSVNLYSSYMSSNELLEKIKDILNVRKVEIQISKKIDAVTCDGMKGLEKINENVFIWKLPYTHTNQVVDHKCEIYVEGENEPHSITLQTRDNVNLLSEWNGLDQTSVFDLLILDANINKQIKIKNREHDSTQIEAKTVFVIQNLESERGIISNTDQINDQSLLKMDTMSILKLKSEYVAGDRFVIKYSNYKTIYNTNGGYEKLDASDNNDIDPKIYQSCKEGRENNQGTDGGTLFKYQYDEIENENEINIDIKKTLGDPILVKTDIKNKLISKGVAGGKGGLGRRYFASKVFGRGEEHGSEMVECPRQRGRNGNELPTIIRELDYTFYQLLYDGLKFEPWTNAKVDIIKSSGEIINYRR